MLATSLTSIPVIIVFSVLAVLLVFLLLIWALARDKGVLRTRFGFYVERERFEEYPETWPQQTREHDTLVTKPPER